MPLSRIARDFAAEIRNHDWSDAPWRLDRAGHNRAADTKSSEGDRVLDAAETLKLKTNVMWVTAQVLGYMDSNFDVYEFAEACGINTLTRTGRKDGTYGAGLRTDPYGRLMRPGAWTADENEVITTVTSDFFHLPACETFRRGWQGAPVQSYPADAVPPRWKPCSHCLPEAQG
ncbi:MAG: hypothetical protein HOY76_28185 [Streptomyces sp.]|nr:hypothetical protein [Streptomyces sp.]NUS88080.1 hypothetical protein [Streptomyces sp.]